LDVSFIFIYTLPDFAAKWPGLVSIEILNRPGQNIARSFSLIETNSMLKV